MGSVRRSRRVVLFDSLEGREFLSLVATPPLEVQSAGQPVIRGTIAGTFHFQETSVALLSVFYSMSGRGSLGPHGPVTLRGQFQQSPFFHLATTFSANATLTTTHHGSLNLTFGGGSAAPLSPEKFAYPDMTGSVIGGTGRFAHAEGTVKASVSLNSRVPGFTSGHFTLVVAIRLTHP